MAGMEKSDVKLKRCDERSFVYVRESIDCNIEADIANFL